MKKIVFIVRFLDANYLSIVIFALYIKKNIDAIVVCKMHLSFMSIEILVKMINDWRQRLNCML